MKSYIDLLISQIMAKSAKEITPFERFIINNAPRYDDLGELYAAYDRCFKADHNIFITADEFIKEVGHPDIDKSRALYEKLISLNNGDLSLTNQAPIITPRLLYDFAHHRWCISNPSAVCFVGIPYNKIAVNTCSEEITEYIARDKVHDEFGFERDRIKIIGKAYYDATDWHFIQFEVNGWRWIMIDGNIYKVMF